MKSDDLKIVRETDCRGMFWRLFMGNNAIGTWIAFGFRADCAIIRLRRLSGIEHHPERASQAKNGTRR
ncbi:hypothetical protein JCM31598_09430 [Desulfonatronum parangueonense]